MTTLIERAGLRGNELLRKRSEAAIHDRALRVFQNANSSPAQKTEALARLRRGISDTDWALIAAVLGASGGSAGSTDAELQAIVDTAYPGLPAPN